MFAAFVPILVLLGIGLAFGRLKLLPEQTPEVLNRLVIVLCLPALIFRHLPGLNLEAELLALIAVPWLLLVASILLVLLAGRLFDWPRPVLIVLALLLPLGNTSFLGYPLVSALLGADRVAYAVVYDQFGSFLILSTYAVIVLAVFGGGGPIGWREITGRLASFPPFIALVLALLLGNHWFPFWLDLIVDYLADMLVPLVMLAVGLQMKFRLSRSEVSPLIFGLVAKLIVLPALAWPLARGLGARPEVFEVVVLEAAMPPMITAALMLVAARQAPVLANALVGYGVLLAMLTIPAWVWLLGLSSH